MTVIETGVSLTLDKLGPSFGAEVIGLDVASASDCKVLQYCTAWSHSTPVGASGLPLT